MPHSSDANPLSVVADMSSVHQLEMSGIAVFQLFS